MDALLVDREIEIRESPGVDEQTTLENTPPGQSGWLRAAIEHMSSLRSLEENWDGYNAAAPDPVILKCAIAFLRSLVNYAEVSAPDISPTRNGGVLFEWENGPHEIEVEMVSRRDASYTYLNTKTDEDRSGIFFNNSLDNRFLELVQNYLIS